MLKAGSRAGGALVRLLLSVVYLRGSIDSLEPHIASEAFFLPLRILLAILFMLFISPLSLAVSLASKRLVYTAWLSVVLYIAWMCTIIVAHTQGTLDTDTVVVAQGRLLQDITSTAFAFSSLTTLQLYSGLVGHAASGNKKEKRYLSISSMSLASSLLATLLVLPLLFPQVKSDNHDQPSDDSSVVQGLIATLTAFILVLAVPPLIATSPPIYVPVVLRRRTNQPLGKFLLLIILFSASLLPAKVMPIIEDAMLILVLLNTYFLPALLHIVLHHLRRPLSIVIRQRSSRLSSDRPTSSSNAHDPDTEELLLRKERALQRRRVGRRILWDVGVWILLVPVGGGGLVWAIGRFASAW